MISQEVLSRHEPGVAQGVTFLPCLSSPSLPTLPEIISKCGSSKEKQIPRSLLREMSVLEKEEAQEWAVRVFRWKCRSAPRRRAGGRAGENGSWAAVQF